jgi:AAA15 family ATPase/GTPase
MIKLKSIEFPSNGIRNIKNIKIDFSERITLIAGPNGIGKSTILGLIASASGLSEKSYFNKPFSSDINNIIHLDPSELDNNELRAPWPKITYLCSKSQKAVEHWKDISITRHPRRLRSVARTVKNSPDKSITGKDAKIPLPTIYLGMLRMLPIGEISEDDIVSDNESMHVSDAELLNNFINKVINGTRLVDNNKIISQSIKKTTKISKHPDYAYSSKSISLGQDSLSGIGTALISFNRLKRNLGKRYAGGLLIIDEIDAGFHPHAQQKLIDALANIAKDLSLQVIATTHSQKLIEYMHLHSKIRDNSHKSLDSIVYLSDTQTPRIANNWSLEEIISDMNLSPLPKKNSSPCIIKAYLEDEEAAFFLRGILNTSKNEKIFGSKPKKKLCIIPIGVGCTNIVNLPQRDDYFKTVLLIIDGDSATEIPESVQNVIKLPSYKDPSTKRGVNPERTLYHYIEELVKGHDCCYKKTAQKLFENGYTSDRLREYFLSFTNTNITKRESAKSWFKKVSNKIEECDLIKFWAEDHKKDVEDFKVNLENKSDKIVNMQSE